MDVEIKSFECDQNLYISIGYLELDCDGSSRCTFGTYANVKGYLKYQNDLDLSGLYDEANDYQYMYLKGNMNTVTVQYDLMDFYPVPLCWTVDANNDDGGNAGYEAAQYEDGQAQYEDGQYDQYQAYQYQNGQNGGRALYDQAQAQYDCPGDGDFPFDVEYKLPSSDNEAISWMATGWTGTSEFYVYAKAEDEGGSSYPLGHCTIAFGTYVTASGAEGLIHTPSAATTVGIILASFFMLTLIAMYCYCCVKRRKRKFENHEGDDITSTFRRMDTTDDGERVNIDGKVI